MVQTNNDLLIALLPYIAGTIVLVIICYFGPSLALQTGKAAGSAVTDISAATAKAATAAVKTALKSQTEASMIDKAGNIADVIITDNEFKVFVTLASNPSSKIYHPIIEAHTLLVSLKPSNGITADVAKSVADRIFG